jgi:enoyl-CoA hydratase/carnithine racemase
MNDTTVIPEENKMLSRKEGRVGIITFNNPQRHNAVSREMWEKTGQMLEAFAADNNVRVVVFTGAGGKAFVSGADISKFEKERATPEGIAKYNATSDRLHQIIQAYEKPIIAMIRGYCIGGGLGLATNCDLRICTENSRFGVPAAKLGLGYAYGGIKRLVDLVGPAFAKEIFFTARQFTAREAYEMGLVNRVVADADLEKTVMDYADTIGANAPLTVKAAKFAIAQAVEEASKKNLARSAELVAQCFASNDYIEGRRAFMEKRKPAFTGT